MSHARWLAPLGLWALMAAVATTPPTGQDVSGLKPEFSFGVVADVQYADAAPGMGRYYARSVDKLESCVDEFNARNVEFVIQLGDLIDRDFASYEQILAVYNKVKAPKYHVLGNHDFSVKREDKDKVRQLLDVGKGYYRFACRGWRFIVLDGNDVSLHGSAPGSETRTAAEELMRKIRDEKGGKPSPYSGALGGEQIAWLKTALTEADKAGEKVVLFSHYPVFPKHGLNLWNDKQVVELLESHKCVAAYFNGHHHAGMYGEQNGVHYVTFKGMVETSDTTAYAIVEVFPDRLKIVGRGRATDRVLELR